MPEYVGSGVEAIRGSTSADSVTLLLGVSGDRAAFAERVEDAGGTIEATLGRATLRVAAPESVVDDLCGLDGLVSIELERDDVRTLDEGNGHSRRRLTRS